MKQLEVYFNEIKAGILTEKHPGIGYSFQYCKDYLDSPMPRFLRRYPKEQMLFILSTCFLSSLI